MNRAAQLSWIAPPRPAPAPPRVPRERLARMSASLVAVVVVGSALIAGATAWLVLTDPVRVATVVQQGRVTPLVAELGRVIFGALRDLLAWL